METLVALALATPIWGFALQPPALPAPSLLPAHVAQLESTARADMQMQPAAPGEAFREAHVSTMMDWTRATNLAASVAFGVTAVLGLIQFSDEYGFNSSRAETACETGNAVLSRCGRETPWEHALAAGTSASLLVTSFGLSTAVDFDLASQRDGDWRTYEVTRFVVLGMVLAQALGGFLLANSERFGWLDRQGDFEVMQGLALGHLALGAATLGLQVANTILVF
jgi:hypothetical protein